jgi:two-component system response regulator ResD
MLPAIKSTGEVRVLVVEDERSIRELVADQLGQAGYACEAIADGEAGLRRLREQRFDVVVLDLMLPGVDGMTICRAVREDGINQDVPILMLTARRAESDKILGFESGADDYVTKPFGVNELTARVGALSRRVRRPEPTPPVTTPINIHGLYLDPVRHVVRMGAREMVLTPHEFELLYQLASQPGVVRTRQALLASVWRDQAFVTERSVDTLIRHLRCKIEPDPASPRLVLTVWGYGYKFRDP